MNRSILLLTTFLLISNCCVSKSISDTDWTESPHDSACYSQGLSFINDTHLLQSCGMYGESYFQIYQYHCNNATFESTYKTKIFPNKYFLQGSIVFPANQILYLLTWREKIVFRYKYTNESNDFKWLSPLKWAYEGWGMTHNNSHIFISDGSHNIFITDENLTILQTIEVTDQNGRKLNYVNELQWKEQDGQQYIFANVYFHNNIYKINLQGKVVQTIPMNYLISKELQKGKLNHDEVLNGIAIKEDTMVVTGKHWKLFFTSHLCEEEL